MNTGLVVRVSKDEAYIQRATALPQALSSPRNLGWPSVHLMSLPVCAHPLCPQSYTSCRTGAPSSSCFLRQPRRRQCRYRELSAAGRAAEKVTFLRVPHASGNGAEQHARMLVVAVDESQVRCLWPSEIYLCGFFVKADETCRAGVLGSIHVDNP